jgi:hypothetical protein
MTRRLIDLLTDPTSWAGVAVGLAASWLLICWCA